VTRDVLSRPAREPDLTIAYGPRPNHLADVRLPPDPRPAPLLVVVHGGFWSTEWDRAHAGPQSEGLADAGFVVATVEYHRAGMPGGGWPGTFDDLAAVADHVPRLVAEAAPGRVAADVRPTLVGHSAGGHLALWAASRHRLPESSPWHRATPVPLAGVVSLAGMADLVDAEERGLGDHAAGDLLGGAPEEVPDRYAEASPAQRLPLGVRTVLVHGTADPAVPVACSRTYALTAAKAGDDALLHELQGVGHFELIDPLSTAWPTVLAAVRSVTAPGPSGSPAPR
jgi:acetyl esterase/lipase